MEILTCDDPYNTEYDCLSYARCAWCNINQQCYFAKCINTFNIQVDGIIDATCSNITYASTDITDVCYQNISLKGFLIILFFVLGLIMVCCTIKHSSNIGRLCSECYKTCRNKCSRRRRNELYTSSYVELDTIGEE